MGKLGCARVDEQERGDIEDGFVGYQAGRRFISRLESGGIST